MLCVIKKGSVLRRTEDGLLYTVTEVFARHWREINRLDTLFNVVAKDGMIHILHQKELLDALNDGRVEIHSV